MTRKFTRYIAWLCIVAHLNLILPPVHVAYAMDSIEWTETSLTVPSKSVHVAPPVDEELQSKSLPSTLGPSDFWDNAVPLVKSAMMWALLEWMGIDPLLTFAVILLGGDALKNAQTTFQSISPSQAKIVFLAAYNLLSFARAALVNGGDNVDIGYIGNGPLGYHNTTVPVPIGLGPQTGLMTDISYQIFVPNGVMPIYEVPLENSSLIPAIENAFLNTKGNVTLTAGLQSVVVRSSSENLKNYLLNVDMPTEKGVSSIQLMYKIYDAMTNESIANATRRFYNVLEADRFRVNKIAHGITAVFGVFLVVVGYFVVRLFCCQENSHPVDPNIRSSEEDHLFIHESEDDESSDVGPLDS